MNEIDMGERVRKRPRPSSSQPPPPPTLSIEEMAVILKVELPASLLAPPEGETKLTSEQKKQRRKIRNRMSAQMHRERQRQHVEDVEQRLREREAEVESLAAENKALLAKVAELEARLGKEDDMLMEGLRLFGGDVDEDEGVGVGLGVHVQAKQEEVPSSNSDVDEGTTTSGTEDTSGAESSGEWEGDEDFKVGAMDTSLVDDFNFDVQDLDLALLEGGGGGGQEHQEQQQQQQEQEQQPSANTTRRTPLTLSGAAALSLLAVCTLMRGGAPPASSSASPPLSTTLVSDSAAVAAALAGRPSRRRTLATDNLSADDTLFAAEWMREEEGQEEDEEEEARDVYEETRVFPRYGPASAFANAEGGSPTSQWRDFCSAKGAAPWNYSLASDLALLGTPAGAPVTSLLGNVSALHCPGLGRPLVTAEDGKGTFLVGVGEEGEAEAGAAAAAAAVDLYHGPASAYQTGDSHHGVGAAVPGLLPYSYGRGSHDWGEMEGMNKERDASYVFAPSAHGMMSGGLLQRALASLGKLKFKPGRRTRAEKGAASSRRRQQSRAVVNNAHTAEADGERRAVVALEQGAPRWARASAGSTPAEDVPPKPGQKQWMVLLLPTSNLDWGDDGLGGGDYNDTYLELGCEVHAARFVDGVTLHSST